MVPSIAILRISLSPKSATYTAPSGPTATPWGKLSVARVANPPSPQSGGAEHWFPVPASYQLVKVEAAAAAAAGVAVTTRAHAPRSATIHALPAILIRADCGG